MSPASQVQSVAQALSEQVVPVVLLAEQAAAQAVPTFVFISSGGTVYGQTRQIPTPEDAGIAPINAYGMVKAQTEQALLEVGRRTGMAIVILRVANPYGPGQQGSRRLGFIAAAAEAAKRKAPVNIWGDGTASRDFVHIDDVADAIARATNHRGESAILNVGTGLETSLLVVCDLVGSLSGHPLKIVFHEPRSVDVQRNCLAIDRARDVLGWQPRIALRAGIANLVGVPLSD
jgi:UDP-glucose 4-epimerase